MMNGFRYRHSGWFGESYRHYLASKGIPTRRYLKVSKDTTIPVVEYPGSYRSVLETRKVLVSPEKAIEQFQKASPNILEREKFYEKSIERLTRAHEQGKVLAAPVVYFDRRKDGTWKPSGFDHFEELLAARNAGDEVVPLVLVKNRPWIRSEERLFHGDFEYSPSELESFKKQASAEMKAPISGRSVSGVEKMDGVEVNVIRMPERDLSKLTDEEKRLLKDENVHETVFIDEVPAEYEKKRGEKWHYDEEDED